MKVSTKEGTLVIEAMEEEIPVIFDFVKNKSKEAVLNGNVVFNSRSGTRRFFEESSYELERLPKYILDKGEEATLNYLRTTIKDKSFTALADIESQARNTCIQGTQADAMKETLYYIDQKRQIYDLDIQLLAVVHDEYHYQMPDYYYDYKVVTNKKGEEVKEINKDCWANIIPDYSEHIGSLYLNGFTRMGYDAHVNNYWEK